MDLTVTKDWRDGGGDGVGNSRQPWRTPRPHSGREAEDRRQR
ncbi:MAG: hypothetical protein ACLTYN_02185 [Dysosmobacter welbionis]